MKALKSAEKKYNARRAWLMWDDGVRDGLESVNEIFSLIESHISENAEMFERLGIKLDNADEYRRYLSNEEFGCQIELTRFFKYSHNHLINLRLEIILFSKIPTEQRDSLTAEFITGFSLKADLTPDNQLIWKDERTASGGLTPRGVCGKMFSLLINQTSKETP